MLGFFPSLKDDAFFPLSLPRALTEPKQAALSDPELNKALFSLATTRRHCSLLYGRISFSLFLIIKKKKKRAGKKREEEREGKKKKEREPTTLVKCLFDTSTALVSFPI